MKNLTKRLQGLAVGECAKPKQLPKTRRTTTTS